MSDNENAISREQLQEAAMYHASFGGAWADKPALARAFEAGADWRAAQQPQPAPALVAKLREAWDVLVAMRKRLAVYHEERLSKSGWPTREEEVLGRDVWKAGLALENAVGNLMNAGSDPSCVQCSLARLRSVTARSLLADWLNKEKSAHEFDEQYRQGPSNQAAHNARAELLGKASKAKDRFVAAARELVNAQPAAPTPQPHPHGCVHSMQSWYRNADGTVGCSDCDEFWCRCGHAAADHRPTDSGRVECIAEGGKCPCAEWRERSEPVQVPTTTPPLWCQDRERQYAHAEAYASEYSDARVAVAALGWTEKDRIRAWDASRDGYLAALADCAASDTELDNILAYANEHEAACNKERELWREYATLLHEWATSPRMGPRDTSRKLRMDELRALLGVTEGTHEDVAP